jgi:hypothetical protein
MRGHEGAVSSISVHGSGRYAITTSSFAIYEVHEHHSGAKRMQHISGIGEPLYWTVNFLYDMVTAPSTSFTLALSRACRAEFILGLQYKKEFPKGAHIWSLQLADRAFKSNHVRRTRSHTCTHACTHNHTHATEAANVDVPR